MSPTSLILAELAKGPATAAYLPAIPATREVLRRIQIARQAALGAFLSNGISGDESVRYPSYSAGRLSDTCRRELYFREQVFADELSCLILRNNMVMERDGGFS